MRKLAVLLFAVLISFSRNGYAQEEYFNITQLREQTVDGWHNVYEAYGRKIIVDIDIDMPDVMQVPIEKIEFAHRETQVSQERTGLEFYIRPDDNIFAFSTPDFIEEIPGEIKKKSELCIGNPDKWDQMYAEGNGNTLSDVVRIIKAALSVMGLDERNWDLEHPYELRTFSFKDPKTNEVVAPGEYMIYFHQKINGIPLLNHAGATYRQKTRGNTTIRLRGSVISEEMYDISLPSLQTSERLSDDVPLCSFTKIINAIEKEIEAGHIRKIYSLNLGYVFYEDPDYITKNTRTTHFYAVPVWQLNCLYMSNSKKELPEYESSDVGNERDSLEYSSIVINAQTGEMQNFMSQKVDRAEYKGVILWSDVK